MARPLPPLQINDGGSVAILVVDMQCFCCSPESAVYRSAAGQEDGNKEDGAYFVRSLETCVANIARLLDCCRRNNVEVLHTRIEALTENGRDLSVDYKRCGFLVTRGSWGAQIINAVKPQGDEIVFSKGSSSVFISTNINYVLRNIGCSQIVIVGGLTDQCIDSAVRDACDLNFYVTLVTDAVYTHSEKRHISSLENNKGYCRQLRTEEVLQEIEAIQTSSTPSSSSSAPQRGERCETITQYIRPPQEFIRFEMIDFNGKALSKLVPYRFKDDDCFMYSGCLSMGANSSVIIFPEEVKAKTCGNTLLKPDWTTEQILPWACRRTDNDADMKVVIKRVYCEQADNDAVPRKICRRMIKELEQFGGIGYQLLSAAELEFVLLKEPCRTPAFSGVDIFATLQGTKVADFMYDIEDMLQRMGIHIKTMNPEYGAGQLEFPLAPSYGIEAGDQWATFKTCIKEMAQQRSLLATFMSKPLSMDGPGNGGHFNFSLWEPHGGDGLRNSFYDPEDNQGGLSSTGRQFLAGILEHAPALEALCSPTPPCYKRHGSWAPTVANWGLEDRSAAVRVKSGTNTYMELRMPSSSMNYYLVQAAVIAAGLDGMERQLALPNPHQEDDARLLPKDLPTALSALKEDTYMRRKMGETFVQWFVDVKEAEMHAIGEAEMRALQKSGSSSEEADAASALMEAWSDMYLEYI